jgi:hypothetical protein
MVARLIQSVGFARELFRIEIDLPKISSSVCRFPLGFLIAPCYIGSIWPESIHGTLFLPGPIAAREKKAGWPRAPKDGDRLASGIRMLRSARA